jgi:hypothetical protein
VPTAVVIDETDRQRALCDEIGNAALAAALLRYNRGDRRRVALVRALLQVLPERDVRIGPILGQVLGHHAEGEGLELERALAAGKAFARGCTPPRLPRPSCRTGREREQDARGDERLETHATAPRPNGPFVL